jgi:hypothetical protein
MHAPNLLIKLYGSVTLLFCSWKCTFDQAEINVGSSGLEELYTPCVSNVSYFDFFRFIDFAMSLDIYYI